MKKCVDCGNNPIPHMYLWIDSTLTVVTNTLSQSVFGSVFEHTHFSRAADVFAEQFVKVNLLLGFMKRSTVLLDERNGRAEVLFAEAKKRGIPIVHLSFFGLSTDTYIATVNDREIVISSSPRAPKTKSISSTWLDDKAIFKKKLEQAGFPVPLGGSANTFSQAKEIFSRIEKPVVVKPRIGSRGRHTTTMISTVADLKKAFVSAKKLCHWVVVEEHIIGDVYRATIIDGVVEGVLGASPPRVKGDGIHTIGELVLQKNIEREDRVKEIALTSAHLDFLNRVGRKIRDLPKKDEIIDLIEKVGLSYGGLSSEDTNVTHPKMMDVMSRVGKYLADPLLGLDFIIPDIRRSPEEQRWGITECNAAPFIDLHHHPLHGKPRNIAAKVWDYVERHIDEF